MPRSVYKSYSAFANTKGGYIILGVEEDKSKQLPEERFIIQGIDILAESAEKSAEKLFDRQKQILSIMETGVEYSADEIAQLLDLKGSRTRQLLNELVRMGAITGTTATKKEDALNCNV